MAIAFKIIVSGNPVELLYPINICTKTKRNYISFKQAVRGKDTQFAYLESPKIISDEALQVTDYLKYYTKPYDSNIYSTKNNIIKSSKSNLIFTTVTTNLETGARPLFYGHKVPTGATAVTFDAWNKNNTTESYVYKSEYDTVLSDVFNDVNIKENTYNASYVKYYYNNKNYAEVFKAEPLYKEASYLDIDPETWTVVTNKPLYWKKYIGNGTWQYTLFAPNDATIYYKEEQLSRKSIAVTAGLPTTQPWPLLLSGSQVAYIDNSKSINYDWSDVSSNAWFPSYGYRQQKKEGSYLNEKSILLPNQKIVLNTEINCHLTIKIIRNNKILFVKTSKSFLVGRRIAGSYMDEDIVKYESFEGNIDYYNGVISLYNTLPLKKTDKIVVEYITEDIEGQKEIGNLNPCHQKLIADYPMLVVATPKTDEEKSKIIKIFFKEVYSGLSAGIETTLYVKSVDNSDYSNLVGLSFDDLIQNHLAFDMLVEERSETFTVDNEVNLLPIAFITFLKNKYVNATKHTDARVFADVKEDIKIERKGKDFTFSKILNPSGMYELDLVNQLVAYVDRSGIPNWEKLDIEKIIKDNVTIGNYVHFQYEGQPLLNKITSSINGENKLVVKLIVSDPVDPNNVLVLYHCPGGVNYSPSDTVLFYGHKDAGFDYEAPDPEATYLYPRMKDGNLYYEFTLDTLDVESLNGKFYFYLKWASGEVTSVFSELTNFTGPTSIACIDTK